MQLFFMYYFIRDVWKRESVPFSGKNSNIIMIYKNKRVKSDCNNCKRISLHSHMGKILVRIMLRRLLSQVSEKVLLETQCFSEPAEARSI